MDYDFSGLCADQIEKLGKRLVSLNKSFVNDYILALGVINSPDANDNRLTILQEIEDHLRDQVAKSEILYTETLNKVQRVLMAHL